MAIESRIPKDPKKGYSTRHDKLEYKQLKPCRFCNEAERVVYGYNKVDFDDNSYLMYVRCQNCDAKTIHSVFEESVRDYWNEWQTYNITRGSA